MKMQMKRYYKSEIAQMAGVSLRTLQRWMVAHREELVKRGFGVHDKFVSPRALKYIVEEYCVSLDE